MNERRRWFQVSLRSLLILMAIVAAYFAGVATMMRRMGEVERDAQDRVEAALKQERLSRLKADEARGDLQMAITLDAVRLRAATPTTPGNQASGRTK